MPFPPPPIFLVLYKKWNHDFLDRIERGKYIFFRIRVDNLEWWFHFAEPSPVEQPSGGVLSMAASTLSISPPVGVRILILAPFWVPPSLLPHYKNMHTRLSEVSKLPVGVNGLSIWANQSSCIAAFVIGWRWLSWWKMERWSLIITDLGTFTIKVWIKWNTV